MKQICCVLMMVFVFFSLSLAEFKSVKLEESSNQYFKSSTNPTGLGITGNFSMETWIKLEQLPSTAGKHFHIVSKGRWGSDYYEGYCLFIECHTGNPLKVVYSQDAHGNCRTIIRTVNAIVAESDVGQWIHLAVTVNVGAKTAIMYKNGVSQAITVQTADAYSVFNNPYEFFVGARHYSGNLMDFFDGLIDEVRVWNDIRTAQEIAGNYQNELIGNEQGLIGYWKFDENANDATANNNHLTAGNSPIYSRDCFNCVDTIVDPDSGQISLDSSDYIHAASIPDMNNNGYPETVGLTVNQESVPIIYIVDGNSNQIIKTLNFFSVDWVPKIVYFYDVDNNGSKELAVMAEKGGITKIEGRKPDDGSLVNVIVLP